MIEFPGKQVADPAAQLNFEKLASFPNFFFRVNEANKNELCVQFPNGEIQVLATES